MPELTKGNFIFYHAPPLPPNNTAVARSGKYNTYGLKKSKKGTILTLQNEEKDSGTPPTCLFF